MLFVFAKSAKLGMTCRSGCLFFLTLPCQDLSALDAGREVAACHDVSHGQPALAACGCHDMERREEAMGLFAAMTCQSEYLAFAEKPVESRQESVMMCQGRMPSCGHDLS